ncbi:MAG: hypothetical protein AAB271_04405, partial [Nitrospirota bacterium]
AVQVGKEIKLSIMDGRLQASADGVFQLEYDPLVLHFKRIGDAELLDSAASGNEGGGEETGKLAFRLSKTDSRAPRSVTVIFAAAAVGVSPVRVELAAVDRDGVAQASDVGTGVVRVR